MTPEEYETTRRLFWERVFLRLIADPKVSVIDAAELADTALEEWKRRFGE